MTTQTELNPRIWIACLATYNAGRLHGKWVDVPDDPDDLREEIDGILEDSPEPAAEEWAVFDYDEWAGLGQELGEHPDLDQLCDHAGALREHGEAYAAWAVHLGATCADPVLYTDAYLGSWHSKEDFAEHLIEEGVLGFNGWPEHLQRYFDLAAFTRDLFLGGDYFALETTAGMHVFDAHV